VDYAVRFEDVYKEYPFYQHITAGFKSFIFNLPGSIASLKKTRFIVLRGVSFEVKKGETFGIIGRNGSGKSTILSIIAGVLRHDKGFVKTNGKISSLLELGAGFHPDLSGIENIILNGILTGNTKKEMLKKADEITRFSELGDFIYQPLRTYSSGMQMRLGFSVAVHIDPEILLIDEALAVGDLSFQEKCLEKMIEFKKSGTTIIIVSHDITAIYKLCDRVAWIDCGSIMAMGKSEEVIPKYLSNFGLEIDSSFIHNPSMPVEEETLEEIEEQSLPAEQSIPLDNGVLSEAYIRLLSWWDSPVIMKQCEAIITGNREVHFYDFLRKQDLIQYLEKGLCIRNRLKGIEANFITYGICKSFDVVEDEDRIKDLVAGRTDLKEGYYDLFLCIDVLSHIENLDLFIEKIDHVLKDKGVIIALEYIGPVNFQWSDKEFKIADMIYRALNNGTGKISSFTGISPDSGNIIVDTVNSKNVIPMLERFFDIVTIRYFGGPLYDLVLNKILERFDPASERDSALIRTVIQCEQILIKENILENNYALIIAKKRSG
jgi:lipopolysaccharide transport system ATP-binding protein